VDVTNYVLMECGQPLHAFDFAKLAGSQIIVRRAQPGEKFEAIDHNIYELDARMCVIADADRPVAIAGVMGGAESEVSHSTTDLLIESAAFDPLAVRVAARTLNLMSPSSFRFERSPDPAMVDWASRRCCELILDLAGGTLCAGMIDAGRHAPPREPIVLRFSAVARLLGIEVPHQQVRRILEALGTVEQSFDTDQIEVVPPTWRADLTREVDLIEEVARIHGYDEIPEDVDVPMAASQKRDVDRVTEQLRHVLTSFGFDEAMTASVVTEEWSAAFSPWTDAPPLATSTPLLRGANHLRRSLVPSLLGARRYNETLSNPVIELFEIAHLYLPRKDELPDEQLVLALTSGGGYFELKGVIETIVARLNPAATLEVVDVSQPLFATDRCGELLLDGRRLGFLGEVGEQRASRFELRDGSTVAELLVSRLVQIACLTPAFVPLSPFPTVERDVNLVVDESVRWGELAATITAAAGGL
ncbi:MAG: phenylalanine--tRNA ligase subunit beta, partial [Pirellulales bacterium]